MRLPFVSRARLDLLQHNFDEARKLHHAEIARLEAALQAANSQLTAERADKRDLLDKYHALKQDGYSVPAPAPQPAEPFGPLTRAALNDMSIGQSGIVRRKMREKATALWLEQRGQQNQDETVAILVRKGDG